MVTLSLPVKVRNAAKTIGEFLGQEGRVTAKDTGHKKPTQTLDDLSQKVLRTIIHAAAPEATPGDQSSTGEVKRLNLASALGTWFRAIFTRGTSAEVDNAVRASERSKQYFDAVAKIPSLNINGIEHIHQYNDRPFKAIEIKLSSQYGPINIYTEMQLFDSLGDNLTSDQVLRQLETSGSIWVDKGSLGLPKTLNPNQAKRLVYPILLKAFTYIKAHKNDADMEDKFDMGSDKIATFYGNVELIINALKTVVPQSAQ